MGMHASAAGLTDVGLQRDHNEDCFVIVGEQNLFIVADGMGGHQAGDVASKIATESVAKFFELSASDDATWPFEIDPNLSDEENRLGTAIRVANRAIFQQSLQRQECRGMGTTIVGALFSPDSNKMYMGHVGDSRGYRIRAGVIEQLTRDHSLVNDYKQAMPELSPEEADELPKNVITRALGMQPQVVVDILAVDLLPGDLFLLCSDGLSGMLEDDEMLAVVNESGGLDEAARALVTRANENGGEDNVTVVLVRTEATESDTARPTEVGLGG